MSLASLSCKNFLLGQIIPSLLISRDSNPISNQIFCTSLDVAKVFGKRHDHVLRDIENILNDLREIGTSNDIPNFGEVVRISKTRNPKNGKLVNRKMPMYNLTRDGFSLLAMGFTGRKAL